MNHDLIKQLELAIQVEKGEVPRDEVQAKYKPGTGNDWVTLEVRDNPHLWDFCLYEYRRKPKPLELWVNIREDGLMRCFDCVQRALADAKSRASNDEMPERSVAVHMREVTHE